MTCINSILWEKYREAAIRTKYDMQVAIAAPMIPLSGTRRTVNIRLSTEVHIVIMASSIVLFFMGKVLPKAMYNPWKYIPITNQGITLFDLL